MASMWSLLAVAMVICGSGRAMAQPVGPYPMDIEDWDYDGRRVLGTVGHSRLNRVAYLWDVATGQIIQRYVGDNATIVAATMLSGGRYVVTASIAGSSGQRGESVIRVWDLSSGRLARVIYQISRKLRKHPSSALFLDIGNDQTTIWDAESGEDIFVFPNNGVFSFNSNGTRAAALSSRRVVVWDMERYVESSSIEADDGGRGFRISRVSDDFQRALVVNYDNTLSILSMEDGSVISTLPPPEKPLTRSFFASDGRRLVQHFTDGSATVIDTDEKRTILTLETGDQHGDLYLTPDARFLVKSRTSVRDGADSRSRLNVSIEVWDLHSGRMTVSITSADPRDAGRFRNLTFAGFAPDGLKMLLVATEDDPTKLTAFQVSLVNGRVISEAELELDPESEGDTSLQESGSY